MKIQKDRANGTHFIENLLTDISLGKQLAFGNKFFYFLYQYKNTLNNN